MATDLMGFQPSPQSCGEAGNEEIMTPDGEMTYSESHSQCDAETGQSMVWSLGWSPCSLLYPRGQQDGLLGQCPLSNCTGPMKGTERRWGNVSSFLGQRDKKFETYRVF
jgi:hypothetical protein